mmetsp:Transcript_20144/g.62577  ORF Transcript_20144/g.62577 Transcript_20144/m.62577 type:complete len:239 (-) Transcript_20144:86-802(-)
MVKRHRSSGCVTERECMFTSTSRTASSDTSLMPKPPPQPSVRDRSFPVPSGRIAMGGLIPQRVAASMAHDTVPSPPHTSSLKAPVKERRMAATSGMSARSKICAGCSSWCSMRAVDAPSCPPDLRFTTATMTGELFGMIQRGSADGAVWLPPPPAGETGMLVMLLLFELPLRGTCHLSLRLHDASILRSRLALSLRRTKRSCGGHRMRYGITSPHVIISSHISGDMVVGASRNDNARS